MDDWKNFNLAGILTSMNTQQFITHSESETRELGRQIGEQLQAGMVVALDGTLGAGKTRLVQGIGIGLGLKADSVVSPTYTICVPYSGRLPLLHLDAYRISDLNEVDELGLDEAIEDGALLVVEWAERIVDLLPPVDLQIRIESLDEQVRRIDVSSLRGNFSCRVPSL